LANFVCFFRFPLTYTEDAHTDSDTKYVKRRGSRQGCTFFGSHK